MTALSLFILLHPTSSFAIAKLTTATRGHYPTENINIVKFDLYLSFFFYDEDELVLLSRLWS